MKKTYFVGDMINNTGPANVNKSYYPYLKDTMYFCFTNNKLLRLLHYLILILFVENVIISGFSELNVLLLKVAKKLNKKTFYLMHGFVKEEVKYNNNVNKEKKVELEFELLNCVDKIICVSEKFSMYLKDIYGEFSKKVVYVNNGVDIHIEKKKVKHDKFTIISVGGGVKQKNNLKICEAINKKKLNVKYIVIGKIGEEGEQIKDFSFVEYYEYLSHEEVLNKMCMSDLYIQNSYFETFGLAIMEALECGCDLLISKNVGALSIIENISDKELINDMDNIDEIAEKIKNKISNLNKCLSYKKNECSVYIRAQELQRIVNK